MKQKVCLVVIFNHNYEKNIEKLEKLYKNRFDDIFYLMPFYKGDRTDVIPVYENSYQFQGFFQQALSKFYRENYTHYVFVADDLIINTRLNQDKFYRARNGN